MIAVVLKLIVRIGLVIAVVVVVVTVFSRYRGQNCQMIGAAVAHADEDCLHLDGPCRYVSGIGCAAAMRLILPKGSTLVVWWPGGKSKEYEGAARP
ncbi:MAG TPA: DddA-like double-stranded DNA deaminase toxin [Pseudonocardiaceae bacterium]|nr:DddA-like double-stranded DNA deaminase toxin [Pseudonocardiaceae bacterium]